MESKRMEEALNAQLNHELAAAHLYLSMSAYCEAVNLPGLARWMRAQAKEEVGHAMKFYTFLCDRRGRVVLQGLEKPQADFGSPLEVFERALQHERKVSGLIHRLVELAVEEKDHASFAFLQELVMEQVEEERSASDVVERLKLAGDDRAALLMIDSELGKREE